MGKHHPHEKTLTCLGKITQYLRIQSFFSNELVGRNGFYCQFPVENVVEVYEKGGEIGIRMTKRSIKTISCLQLDGLESA